MTLVEATGLVKDFPGVRALDGVDFTLEAGEVHALLGHNGAGKSTLVKIVAGDVRPDSGSLRVGEHAGAFTDPADALRAGVRIVTQERSLVPTLSIEENVLLGRLPRRRGGRVDWSETRRRARQILNRLGLELDPGGLVGRLAPAQQTLVELARALSEDARVLVLDEPTAALSEHETERLFGIVRGLTAHGVGVILVSHRVADIRALADRATVLRDGRVVLTGALADLGAGRVIQEMSGDAEEPTSAPGTRAEPGRTLMVAEHVSVPGVLDDVDLSVRAGEVVGIFGLVGSGAVDVPVALFGGVRREGSVRVDERAIRTPRDAARAGVGLVPGDRQEGILFGQPVQRNLGLANLPAYRAAGVYRRRAERRAAVRWISTLDVRPAAPGTVTATLSGGNQQKTLVGRWLERDVRVLLLAEPTKGVDVATRAAIHRLLLDLRDNGTAVVLASSDLDEVALVSDRVLVLARGRIVGELPGGAERRGEVMRAAAS